MNSEDQFYKDLKTGQIYEHKAMNILAGLGFSELKKIEGYEPRYDIEAIYKNKKVYIEVKYNSKVHTLKQFVVELGKSDGTPSGLTVTKSHYYMLFSNDAYYLLKTKDLHKTVKRFILKGLSKLGVKDPTPDIITDYIINKCFSYGNYRYMKIHINVIVPYCIEIGKH